ncbi:hypothetical protein GQ53DRAFT_385739 [Thozetella sp. PMI_491]|nr:hypothetical protein GQ53DRAFT_385739 [Thozetella sp. PMI_491]
MVATESSRARRQWLGCIVETLKRTSSLGVDDIIRYTDDGRTISSEQGSWLGRWPVLSARCWRVGMDYICLGRKGPGGKGKRMMRTKWAWSPRGRKKKNTLGEAGLAHTSDGPLFPRPTVLPLCESSCSRLSLALSLLLSFPLINAGGAGDLLVAAVTTARAGDVKNAMLLQPLRSGVTVLIRIKGSLST